MAGADARLKRPLNALLTEPGCVQELPPLAISDESQYPQRVLSYLAILAVSLCGYASLPISVVGAATIALASLSYAEHHRLYKRGAELGLFNLIDTTLMRSLFNALCAAVAAYAFGIMVRMAG